MEGLHLRGSSVSDDFAPGDTTDTPHFTDSFARHGGIGNVDADLASTATAGVSPKVMSGRLGHATVAFTQDVYVHAMPEREQEAADIVAALFRESDPTGTD